MVSSNVLKMGIIGCGSMGEIHAACYAKHSGFEVVALYNPTCAKAEALAQRFGGQVYDSVDALIAAPIDAVAVCSPQTHHAEQILKAVAAGKHIFCEKPVALTVEQLDAIEAAVAEAGVTFMTGHQLRFHPVVDAVREAMPKLGRCYHLDLEWCFRLSGHEGRCWASYETGGFFMELGCHVADLAAYLLGDVIHVSGHTLRLDPQRVTEDYTNATLQFANHAVASLLVSANHRTGRQGLLSGRLIGEHGAITFTIYPFTRALNKATLTIDHGKKVFVPDVTKTKLPLHEGPSNTKTYLGFYDVYDQEAEDFLTAVRTGAESRCTLADGRQAIEVILATYHQQALATQNPSFKGDRCYLSNADAHPILGA